MADGRTLVAGRAEGSALVLGEALSFWGGLDPATGRLIDVHHPRHGTSLTGRILVMPAGRGSSSSSYVLAEAIRSGTGPAAILLLEPDPIVALGAIVARELYDVHVPVVVIPADVHGTIADGRPLRVDASADDAVVAVGRPDRPG
jgi:uncharacterized protein